MSLESITNEEWNNATNNGVGWGGGDGSDRSQISGRGLNQQQIEQQQAAAAAEQARQQQAVQDAINRYTAVAPKTPNLLESIKSLFSYKPTRDNTPGINPYSGILQNDPVDDALFTAGLTGPTLADYPRPPGSEFFGDEGGNYQAITNFLSNPNYGNIPTNQIDVVAATNALQQALAGIDNVVDTRGFTGLGYGELGRNRARSIFDTFSAGQNFDDLLNYDIGTQFGNDSLTDTQNNFRTEYTTAANDRFGQGFADNLIDPDLFNTTVNNILGDRRDSASRIIGNAGARGNLSTAGQATANESLGTQVDTVRDRITGTARGVESQGQNTLTGIGDEARGGASGFSLGDSAFDITPFSDRATSQRESLTGSFGGDVNSALGNDPLFDTGTALSTAAGSQGVVSGTPSFLDTIAQQQKQGSNTNQDRRGLGSRGSGTF
jgi:hypothetical protein